MGIWLSGRQPLWTSPAFLNGGNECKNSALRFPPFIWTDFHPSNFKHLLFFTNIAKKAIFTGSHGRCPSDGGNCG
jgi:hypothetical protein